MTSSAIVSHPIKPIANIPVDGILAATLLTSIADYSEQLQGRRIWLACSGGRDSLALAALCVQLYHQGKLPFLPQLLHVDHGLQSGSGLWAEHVASWAQAQQIPCHILPTQVDGHDEQAARRARYSVMRAQMNQGDVLMLAHHADDQAETLLMRLIQGAGVTGLSGMQPWRLQTHGVRQNILWRPWLTIQRASISAYANHLKLPYIDDPTNDTGDNIRSGLRRDIMPVLAQYNPNVIDNMSRSAQLLSEAQATVHASAEQDLQTCMINTLSHVPLQRVLCIDRLKQLPYPRQRQLLHHWLSQDEPLPPSKQLVDDAYALTQRQDNDHQTQLHWQASRRAYRVRRYRQQLYRLSEDWIDWLTLVLVPQTVLLDDLVRGHLVKDDLMTDDLQINKAVNKAEQTRHESSQHQSLCADSATLILRRSADIVWQLDISSASLEWLSAKYGCKATLKIAPLQRQQRVHTSLTNRPQSGKKLYQTLGIPTWLRDSLVVVSIVLPLDKKVDAESADDIPIALLSAMGTWSLLPPSLVSDEYCLGNDLISTQLRVIAPS